MKTLEDLSAFVDGELGPEEELALRRHLDTCISCQQMVNMLAALKETVARTAEVYPLPRSLRGALPVRPQESHWWTFFSFAQTFRVGSVFALMLIAFAAGSGITRQRGTTTNQHSPLIQALVAYHIDSLSRPSDLGVSSADPGIIEAWFQEQVPFPVRVSSLSNARLLGGNVSSLLGQPVALVVYERDGKRISLFTLAPEAFPAEERIGRAMIHPENPECLTLFDNYAFCLNRSEEVVQAVVTEGLVKMGEFFADPFHSSPTE
jgi:anti-sigma factor RsiW